MYTRMNVFKDAKLDSFQKEFYEFIFYMVYLIEALRMEKRYEEADLERKRLESWGFKVMINKDGYIDERIFHNRSAWAKFFNNCELIHEEADI